MITKTIYKIFTTTVGIYIGSQKYFIYVPSKNLFKEFNFQNNQQSQNGVREKMVECVSQASLLLRRYFKKWPLLRIVLCNTYDDPSSEVVPLQDIIDKYNLELYLPDIRICIAVGLGLPISDEKKYIILIVANNFVHGFIEFCGGVYFETKIDSNKNDNLNDLIVTTITKLVVNVSHQVPEHFNKLSISKEELTKIKVGWESDFDKNVSLIFSQNTDHPTSINKEINGYKINVFNNEYECIKNGLLKITDNVGILINNTPTNDRNST
jgi:hypothetical protein